MLRFGNVLPRNNESNFRAVLLMVGGTIFFSSMHALIRYLSADLHAFELAFFRNLFGVLVVLPWVLRAGLSPLKTNRLGLHSVRGLFNGIGMLMFFYAVSIAPLADVIALSFTAPIFATILAIVFLREVVGVRRWTAIFVAFLGMLIILRPGLAEISQGQFLAMASSALWACSLIMIKILGRTESSITIIAYMIIFQAPVSGLAAMTVWITPTLEQVCVMATMGVLGTVGQWLLIEALKAGDTNVVMPFDFLKMIWAVLLGFLFFNELPGLFTWIGSTVIFSSAVYIAWRESKIRTRATEELVSRPPEQ
jgi:drug/metabolite transporter (DMT)-like permease